MPGLCTTSTAPQVYTLDSQEQVLSRCAQLHDTAYLQASIVDIMLLTHLHINGEKPSCLSAWCIVPWSGSLESTEVCSLFACHNKDNHDQELAIHTSVRLPAAQNQTTITVYADWGRTILKLNNSCTASCRYGLNTMMTVAVLRHFIGITTGGACAWPCLVRVSSSRVLSARNPRAWHGAVLGWLWTPRLVLASCPILLHLR